MEGEKVIPIHAVATLILGLVIGYLGQRSRLCSVSGYRDLYLIRDTYLFKGILGILIGALTGFVIFNRIGGDMPGFPLLFESPEIGSPLSLILGVIAGLGYGFFSVMAEGCPFRQHVMASEGKRSAIAYLIGFYVGIIYFFTVITNYITLLIKLVG